MRGSCRNRRELLTGEYDGGMVTGGQSQVAKLSPGIVAPALKRGPKDTSVSIRTTAIQMWSDPEEIYQRRLILFERSRELLRVINTCIFGLWSCIE